MARRRRSPDTTKAFLILGSALIFLYVALPTAIVATVGMMPTMVAFIVDVTRRRYLTKSVAGMNFAGVAPFLHELLIKGHDLPSALAIVTDAFAWLVMYSAAGMGWLLFLGLPGLVSMARMLNAKLRIYVLHEKQKTLLNEWGECILPASETAPQTDADAPSPGRSADRRAANPEPVAR